MIYAILGFLFGVASVIGWQFLGLAIQRTIEQERRDRIGRQLQEIVERNKSDQNS